MSPRSVTDPLLREAPVVQVDERLCGIFAKREFLGAIFPGYLKQLSYAGFVKRSLEDALGSGFFRSLAERFTAS